MQYANLIRYMPSGKYFARIRIEGKLIRQLRLNRLCKLVWGSVRVSPGGLFLRFKPPDPEE